MYERDFYYWLQGFFELSGATELDERQVQIVKEHMALVATKVTESSMDGSESESAGVRGMSEDEIRKLLTDHQTPYRPQTYCSTSTDKICHAPQHLTC